MSNADTHAEHAARYREFAVKAAEERFRAILAPAYQHASDFIREFLGSRQSLPHLRIGGTPPRSLSCLAPFTGHGARWEIILNARLLMHPVNPAWVQDPWPAPGLVRFVHGLLEKQLVCQYVREVEGLADDNCGSLFCHVANRISAARGWPAVIPRRRPTDNEDALIGKSWPIGPHYRTDPACFGDDITEAAIELAIGSPVHRTVSGAATPELGIWQVVLYLLATNRADDLRCLATVQIDRLQATQRTRWPVLAAFEEGEEEEDETRIEGKVHFEPGWLVWNGGLVRTLTESIHAFRDYLLLPILADALEEAGCTDGRILRHLRAQTKGHDSRCWVIRRLLDNASSTPST
jgi:hypothetical protein